MRAQALAPINSSIGTGKFHTGDALHAGGKVGDGARTTSPQFAAPIVDGRKYPR